MGPSGFSRVAAQAFRKSSVKVLHIIPSVSPIRGGPSKAVIDMVGALIEQGVDASIVTTNDDGANELNVPLNSPTQYQGVPVMFFKRWSPMVHALREFAFSNAYRVWLKENISNYDLVHIHAIFSFTSSYAMYLARKHNIPYVIRPIGQLETWSLQQSKWRKRAFLSLFERKNLSRAQAIHYTAESEKKQANLNVTTLNPDKAHVIPLGVHSPMDLKFSKSDFRKKYQLDNNTTVFLFLSRIHPKKGLELLIDAFGCIEDQSWTLLIAGDGSPAYLNSLKQRIKDVGLSERCKFTGFVEGEEKDQLMQCADFYTLTSYSENFGIAVLEALGAGTPVIVTKEVALSEQVATHKLGYVCDLSIESVKGALTKALSKNTRDLADTSKFVEQNYSWHSISQKLIDLYCAISKN